MRMSNKETALALREWRHWSKYWYIYLVIFGLTTATFLIIADTAIFETTIIGIIAGISAFFRQLSNIHGRLIYSFIAVLGVMVPVILLVSTAIDNGGILVLFLLGSIIGVTVALLHGIISIYYLS